MKKGTHFGAEDVGRGVITHPSSHVQDEFWALDGHYKVRLFQCNARTVALKWCSLVHEVSKLQFNKRRRDSDILFDINILNYMD